MVIQVRISSKRVYTPASTRESTFVVTNRDAVRRRRARVLRGLSPQYPVVQAQRRNTADALLTSVCCRFAQMPLLSVEPDSADVHMVEFSGLTSGRNTLLPRRLRRSTYEDVSRESITDLDPALADVPLDYIRETLQVKGPGMLKQLINIGPITVGSNLPEEVSVVINDDSFDMPTHVFAISPLPGNEQNPLSAGCVLPIHDVVLASHCVDLPLLKPSKPVRSSKSGLITLPVVALRLPSPGTFPVLMAHLYTKRVDALLLSLFPALPSRFMNTQSTSDGVETLPEDTNKSLKLILAETLVHRYNIDGLLQIMLLINGLWRNTRMFGIFDERLWSAIDFAWAATLTALAISTGNPGLMGVRVSSNRGDQDSAV